MSNPMIKLAIAMGCMFVASSTMADSPVWKISKDDNTMYIGGTIHVLAASDYPLPDAFSSAYASSSTVVFETDVLAAQAPENAQKVMAMLSYSDGKTLADDISPETLKALTAYCTERGLPLEAFLNFKAGMLLSVLTVVELQRLGIAGTGVDQFYTLKAIDDKKNLKELESIDEQISFLAKLGEGNEDRVINLTLRDMAELPTAMAEMKAAWRSGDMRALDELAIDPMEADFPNMFKLILANRNNDWMPEIEAMIATPEVEFVMVGALHLAGEVGLLQQLKRKGYTVTQQ